MSALGLIARGVEVGQADLGAFTPALAGFHAALSQADQQGLGTEHLSDDAVGIGDEPAGDRDVDGAVSNRGLQIGEPHPLHVEHDAGGPRGEGVTQVRAEDRGDRRGDAHPNRAGVSGRDAANCGLRGG